LIRVYVDQALSPVLVVLPAHQVLMPERRRITIRRQSGGGPLQLPRSWRRRPCGHRHPGVHAHPGTGSGVSPGGFAEGGVLCACRVMTGGTAPWDRGSGAEPRRERPRRATDRPSAFQAGHIASWRESCGCYALSPVVAACCWLLLLLSARVTQWSRWFRQPGPGVCLDRLWTRRGCRSAREAPARPAASPAASAADCHTGRARNSRARSPRLARGIPLPRPPARRTRGTGRC